MACFTGGSGRAFVAYIFFALSSGSWLIGPNSRRIIRFFFTSLLTSSKYFGTRKCCHPQISDLVIRLVFFRESSRKIINKLTSRLPSCESSIPGRFALFECNSNDVRICKKISQESCHQEIMKPKSDICGWQHLWGPKDLLNNTFALQGHSHHPKWRVAY